MKSTAILAIAASAVVSVASAQELLSYGAPISSTVWTAGQDATISWSNSCADLPVTSFPVTLQIQRPDKVQDPVAGVAPLGTIDCAKPGSITIKVPATVASGSSYSILVKTDPLAYSALFTINNTALPANATTPTVTGVVPVPTATPINGTASVVKPTVTVTATTTVTPSGTPKPTSGAGALKAGSVAALAIAGAVAALIF